MPTVKSSVVPAAELIALKAVTMSLAGSGTYAVMAAGGPALASLATTPITPKSSPMVRTPPVAVNAQPTTRRRARADDARMRETSALFTVGLPSVPAVALEHRPDAVGLEVAVTTEARKWRGCASPLIGDHLVTYGAGMDAVFRALADPTR